MKKIISHIFFIIVTVSQAQVNVQWVQNTAGVSIAVDSNNNVYTVYYEYNPAGDIYLTKRNSDGVFIWQEKIDQTDNSKWEKATWVATDNLGNILVSGTLMSGYSNPVEAASILMKFDSAGNLIWRNVYENSFDGSYTKKCLVDNNNNIYVLGMGSGTPGYVTKVKKFAPDGSSIWTYFDANGIGRPINFKFTPEDAIVITGRSIFGSVNGYAKIDLNGNHIWSYSGINSLTIGDCEGDDLGNTYLVHGEYVANGGTELKKISPTGSLLWSNVYNLAGFRVEVGSDNQPVVCGFPNPNSFGSSFIKVDSNGNLVWSNPDADSTFALMLHAKLIMDQNDNIYLAAGTLTEMAVCKVNNDGTSAWTITMPGSYANDIVLGIDNNVYVVGGNTAKINQSLITTFQLAVNVSNGWNMVSVPGLNTPNQNVNTWWQYRDVGTNVFRYLAGYQSITDAVPGTGYWMKHSGARTYNTGDEWPAGGIQIVPHNPLTGTSGWNLIGGYEMSVTAANVTTNPPGLQSGPIYKYSGGYQTASTIDPGYGYWMKLTESGQIIIPETMAKESNPVDWFPEEWGKIVFIDAENKSFVLYCPMDEFDLTHYELPPTPPSEMFDIRYETGRIAEKLGTSIQNIQLSGVRFPLTVKVEGIDLRLVDETGKNIKSNLKSGEEVVLKDATMKKLGVSTVEIPEEYALEQNYPNPFNPATTIRYSIPKEGLVTLKIYNTLGEEIKTLVNEIKQTGNYVLSFDASSLPSGVYFYRLSAESFTEVKKMILVK